MYSIFLYASGLGNCTCGYDFCFFFVVLRNQSGNDLFSLPRTFYKLPSLVPSWYHYDRQLAGCRSPLVMVLSHNSLEVTHACLWGCLPALTLVSSLPHLVTLATATWNNRSLILALHREMLHCGGSYCQTITLDVSLTYQQSRQDPMLVSSFSKPCGLLHVLPFNHDPFFHAIFSREFISVVRLIPSY